MVDQRVQPCTVEAADNFERFANMAETQREIPVAVFDNVPRQLAVQNPLLFLSPFGRIVLMLHAAGLMIVRDADFSVDEVIHAERVIQKPQNAPVDRRLEFHLAAMRLFIFGCPCVFHDCAPVPVVQEKLSDLHML
jgi:hypothetical protein